MFYFKCLLFLGMVYVSALGWTESFDNYHAAYNTTEMFDNIHPAVFLYIHIFKYLLFLIIMVFLKSN